MPETIQAAPQKQGLVARLDSTAFARKRPELWKFVKFMVAGFLSAAPEFVTYLALRSLLRNVEALPHFILFEILARNNPPSNGVSTAALVYAFMLSTAVGYTVNFFLNRKATFHADSNVALSTFLYVLLVLFTIVANSFIGPAIELLVGKISFLPLVLVPTVAKVLAMIVPNLWGYPANRFLIHRKRKEAAHA